MTATIEIPDDLYRQIEARSAREGRPVQDVAAEIVARGLADAAPELSTADAGAHVGGSTFVPVGTLMAELCGMGDSGVSDLSTNPAYLEDLGDNLGADRGRHVDGRR